MKTIIKKAVFCFFTVLFASLKVFAAQGIDYFLTLRYAQNAFDSGDYGKALALAEQAKDERRKDKENELKVLDQIQKVYAVRRAGDSLEDIVPILKERNQRDALEIIEHYTDTYGNQNFDGRISKLKDFISFNKEFPESDFLIGRIYRLEGEVSIAKEYMDKAYAKQNILNVPDLKYDILYELADLAKSTHDEDSYQKYLLTILKDDKFYSDDKVVSPKNNTYYNGNSINKNAYMNSLVNVIKNAKNEDSVDKFFLLYRNDTDISIKALAGLSEFYNRKNEKEKALRCSALGCITALTKIQEILEDRLTDYSYTTFEDLLKNASLYNDIVEWGNKNGIWSMYHNFAEFSSGFGNGEFSKGLFHILMEYSPEPYWRVRAQKAYKDRTQPLPFDS